MAFYGADLAYIHDTGFSDYIRGAAPGLLRILRQNGVAGGLVVDLGCGSGRWARELNRRGYGVMGIDRSPALVRLARRIAGESRFVRGSLWTARLPRCDAVTSIGECLDYDSGSRHTPAQLFGRVHARLRPGGVFLFDAATPARIPAEGPRRHWTEGRGWTVLVETTGDRKRNTLTRRIICYRKIGARYRPSEEVHVLRLYRPEDLLAALSGAGFRARQVSAWGRFRLPEGIAGFIGAA
ncbi:MAG TPA: class I SAM-dependent methyltransferase [Bryobacteraceae bacterium]|nr:class I SAM-dependent methyltransferase [Bryobacteraceae bacterium]